MQPNHRAADFTDLSAHERPITHPISGPDRSTPSGTETESVLRTILATGGTLTDWVEILQKTFSFSRNDILAALAPYRASRPVDVVMAVAALLRNVVEPREIWNQKFRERKAQGIEDHVLSRWHYDWAPEVDWPENVMPTVFEILHLNKTSVAMALFSDPEFMKGRGSSAVNVFLKRLGMSESLRMGFYEGEGPFMSSLQWGGKVKAIAPGTVICGHFELQDCKHLEALPEGLTVRNGLFLNDCTKLQTLPVGLRVGGRLDLTGCSSWDGIIPEDAQIGGDILCDAHPDGDGGNGIPLEKWRDLYGTGPCPRPST